MTTPNSTKTLFVTVGTTLFQPLIDAIAIPSTLRWLRSNDFTHVILQFGKGTPPQLPTDCAGLVIECYDFKPSLRDDMARAEWILCHAGAGTLMEALHLPQRPVVATVINTRLMDNHQTELAYALRDRGHVQVVEDPVLLQHCDAWEVILRKSTCSDGSVLWKTGDDLDFPRIPSTFFGDSIEKED